MDAKTQQQIRTKLEEEAHDIKSRLKKFTDHDAHGHGAFRADFPEFGSKEDENAAEVATFQDNLGLEADLQRSLDEIRHALEKLDQGTFGRCEQCGQAIDPARLEAFPSARLCMTCNR